MESTNMTISELIVLFNIIKKQAIILLLTSNERKGVHATRCIFLRCFHINDIKKKKLITLEKHTCTYAQNYKPTNELHRIS